jgi:Membrane proteins related to metalloendopeptidases
MKKVVIGLAMVLALMVAAPLAAAVMIVVVSSPAAGEELKAQECQSGSTVATGPWRVPTAQKYVITSGFGHRTSPGGGVGSIYHEGVDIAMLPNPGSVLAAAAGTVKVAGPYGGLGNAVVLDNSSGISTTYGHMAKLDAKIKVGSKVTIGQRLGLEGSTGNSTGNHLHFGVAENGKYINPVPFMSQHGAPLNGQQVAPAPPKKTPPGDPGGVRRDRVPAAAAREATEGVAAQPAHRHPQRYQGVLREGRQAVQVAVDPAGRNWHGGDLARV